MRVLLIGVVVAGCHVSSSDRECPASVPQQTVVSCNEGSLSCTYGGTTCQACADSSAWVCSTDTCPWDMGEDQCTTDPNDSTIFHCTCGSADTTCDVSGFEADCSCSCEDVAAGRYWSCFNGLPKGFSRPCPTPP